jgi:uncharacterized protein YegP (UPF0339 family)
MVLRHASGGTGLAYVRTMMMKTSLLTLALVQALGACAVDTTAPSNVDDYYTDGKDDASRPGMFETFTGKDGKYYFHLIAGNGQKVLQSQAYTSASGAKNGIASVRANGTNEGQYRVLEAQDAEWYFNLLAANWQTIGTSEMYVSESNADRAVETVGRYVTTANMAAAHREAKFQVFAGIDGHYYFHLRADNGEIVLQSQAYTRRTSAVDGTSSVSDNGADPANYEIRDAQNGQAYFVLKAANGQVVGVSETYASESNAQRGIDTVSQLIADGTVVDAM